MALAPSITINLPGYPFNNLTSYGTVALLRAASSSDLANGQDVTVDAGTTAGDGLGGVYSWNAASTANDDGYAAIKPTDKTSLQAGRWLLGSNLAAAPFLQSGTGATSRTVQDKLRETVSVADWGAFPDNASDATAAIQKAFNECPLGWNLFFPAGPTPDYYYRVTSRLKLSRKINLVGPGARLNGYFASSSDVATNDLLWINIENTADQDARNFSIEGFRGIGFVTGGRNAIRVTNDSPNLAQIGLSITHCGIGVLDASFGYAVRFEGIGTHTNNTIEHCQIENGVYLACADGTTVERNNMFGRKTAVTLNLIDGAYQTSIINNVITARDGALNVLNGNQWLFANNQCEQFPGYEANASTYGAQVTINGQNGSYPVADGKIIGNNFGAGTNCAAAVVIAANCIDLKIDDNVFRLGTALKDIRILANTCKGAVVGNGNNWRGNNRTSPDAGWAAQIEDSGVATRGIWKEVVNGDLSNGWTVAGSFRYMVDEAGFVHFDGGLTVGTATGGTAFFTLPVGFRPRADRVVSVDNNAGTNDSKIMVRSTGAMEALFVTATNAVYINGSFRAQTRAAYVAGPG